MNYLLLLFVFACLKVINSKGIMDKHRELGEETTIMQNILWISYH